MQVAHDSPCKVLQDKPAAQAFMASNMAAPSQDPLAIILYMRQTISQ